VRDAAAPGALVAPCAEPLPILAGLAAARPAAIAVAAIAAAAQDDLDATARAQVQAGGWVHAHPGTTEVLDGLAPARHTAVAPPSSARCRARYGRQASRRVRPLPCPPSSASTALYRGVPTAPPGYRHAVTADTDATAALTARRPRLPGRPAGRPGRRTSPSKPERTSRRCSGDPGVRQNRHLTVE